MGTVTPWWPRAELRHRHGDPPTYVRNMTKTIRLRHRSSQGEPLENGAGASLELMRTARMGQNGQNGPKWARSGQNGPEWTNLSDGASGQNVN